MFKSTPIQIRVRALRKEQDLTQEMLAERLGISRQSVIALESGKYLPSLPLALSISEIFDLPLEQIFICDTELTTTITNSDVSALSRSLSDYSSWPPVNLTVQENQLVLRANIAGYNKDEVEVEIEPHSVTINGHSAQPSQQQTEYLILSEMITAGFKRRVSLPQAVDIEKSEARVKDGLLIIIMPFSKNFSKRIKVN